MAKCKYDPFSFPVLAEGYAREGMVERDIAAKLGVSVATFETYKNKYPEFLSSLKKGQAPVDFEVENALIKRCLGYDYEEETIEWDNDGGERVESKVKVTRKHMPPDVGAIQTWLSNRNNQKWKRNPDLKNQIDRNTETIDFEFEVINED